MYTDDKLYAVVNPYSILVVAGTFVFQVTVAIPFLIETETLLRIGAVVDGGSTTMLETEARTGGAVVVLPARSRATAVIL